MRYVDLIKIRDTLIIDEMVGNEDSARRRELEGRLQEAIRKADEALYHEQLPIIEPEQRDRIIERLRGNIVG